MFEIAPLRAERDGPELFELYRAALGHAWPLEPKDLAAVARDGFIARVSGRLVGVAALTRRRDRASIDLLVVSPEARKRGVGSALHAACLSGLAETGVREVRLGGTPGPYLWPGVPVDLPEANAFFSGRGWSFRERAWDLVRSLADFSTPPELAERPGRSGFRFRTAIADDLPALAAFERRHFPEWAGYVTELDDPGSAVLAYDAEGAIAGSLLVAVGDAVPWRLLLGERSGAIGAVGVSEPARGKGVGTGLVAEACELLHGRGVANCHVGWTSLLSFYERLGFRPWREYELSWRSL